MKPAAVRPSWWHGTEAYLRTLLPPGLDINAEDFIERNHNTAVELLRRYESRLRIVPLQFASPAQCDILTEWRREIGAHILVPRYDDGQYRPASLNEYLEPDAGGKGHSTVCTWKSAATS